MTACIVYFESYQEKHIDVKLLTKGNLTGTKITTKIKHPNFILVTEEI